MKIILTCLLLAFAYYVNAQTITKYSDSRIPSDMNININNITMENFDSFSASGTSLQKYEEIEATFTYDIEYSGGFIIGTIEISDNDTVIANLNVQLPFVYCCDHSPRHCSKSPEEIKNNQEKHKCSGWHRAEIE